jgi:hypothetical protein
MLTSKKTHGHIGIVHEGLQSLEDLAQTVSEDFRSWEHCGFFNLSLARKE